MAEATFLFLKVSGDEAVRSASEVLGKFMDGMTPQAPSAPVPLIGSTDSDGERYEKPADEPDGFDAPEPPRATKVKHASNYKPVPKKPKADPTEGHVGPRIVRLLDTTGGVAPMELLVERLKLPPQSIGRAVGHSKTLQRLPDGRVALVGWHDEDE